MRIHNIYVDDAGETHWRDIEVEWVQERNGSKLSERLPATGIIFRETGGDYDLSWHPAPRRQYIINLDGGVKITASDGEAREIGAGEVTSDATIAKVSLIGAGMRSHPGVSATMFETLAEAGINIEMISTSSIRLSCVVRAESVEEAVRLLHAAFELAD